MCIGSTKPMGRKSGVVRLRRGTKPGLCSNLLNAEIRNLRPQKKEET